LHLQHARVQSLIAFATRQHRSCLNILIDFLTHSLQSEFALLFSFSTLHLAHYYYYYSFLAPGTIVFPSKTAEGEVRAENGGGAGEGGGDETPRAAAEADIKATPA
jgi:hypothetical protein